MLFRSPANCTVDLNDYPIEFIEPKGLDCLILIASEEPFDLRMVNRILSTSVLDQNSKYPVGVYKKNINVK